MEYASPTVKVRFQDSLDLIASHLTTIVNINEKEKIRSIFMNTLNDSIFVVSVREKTDCSKMKCRSLPL